MVYLTDQKIKLCIILIIGLIFGGCATKNEQNQITKTSIETPTNTQTLIPSLTFTLTPSPTQLPTPTATLIGGGSGIFVFEKVCFVNLSPCGSSIYKYDLQTNQLTLLFENHHLLGVSPDGTKLLVNDIQHENANNSDLFLANLDGTDIKLLYKNVYVKHNLAFAQWLPGTDLIAFLATVDRKVQIFVIYPDGTGLSQVTQSSIGVIQILPAFNGGLYWGEGSNGGFYGYRWTKSSSSETKDLHKWGREVSFNFEGSYVAYLSSDEKCLIYSVIGCSIKIEKLDGSDVFTFPVSNLQLPEEDIFPIFTDLILLPNLDVITEVSPCNICRNRFFLFYSKGEKYREILTQEGVLDDHMGLMHMSLSPDGSLLLIPSKGSTGGSWNLFSIESERSTILPVNFDRGWATWNLFWLANNK